MLGFIQRSCDIFLLKERRYELHPQPVNLLSLLPRLEQELTPLLRAHQVDLAASLRGQPPGPGAAYLVAGEEALLEVLLGNLLKNAIEAAPPGSQVRVSLGETPGDRRRMDIRNLGAVPAEIRSRFFEPYVTSGKREGTGLGTHSARLVARAHGGELDFTTSDVEGIHLLLTLPRPASQG